MLGEAVVSHGTQGEVSTVTTGALSAVVGAVCTVLVMYFKTKAKVTVDGEVNVKGTAGKKSSEVSWTEVRDLKDRQNVLEARIEELRSQQGRQFAMVMESQHQSELRVLEKIDDCMRPLHARIDQLLQILADKHPKK
jgi:hypothetical protein